MIRGKFLRQTLERAVKSAAQAPLVAWGIGDKAANALEFDWKLGGGFALGAAVVSILTSIASAPIGEDDSPSLV